MARKHRKTIQKKNLNDIDNHDGVVTQLEPDILEYEVKWALGIITKNKASGDGRIPAELLKILKDDTVKSAALNMPASLENSAVATGLGKINFFLIPNMDNAKKCSNYHTNAC